MRRLRPLMLGMGAALAAASIALSAPLEDRQPPSFADQPPPPLNKRQRIDALKQADADRRAKQKAQRIARRRNRHG